MAVRHFHLTLFHKELSMATTHIKSSTPTQVTRLCRGGLILYGWADPTVKDPRADPRQAVFLVGGAPGDGVAVTDALRLVDVRVHSVALPLWKGDEELVFVPEGCPPPTGFTEYRMERSVRGTRFGLGKGRWGVCHTCLEEFPTSQMSKVRGRWYCHKNGCAEEQG